jgi:hypothetical protein
MVNHMVHYKTAAGHLSTCLLMRTFCRFASAEAEDGRPRHHNPSRAPHIQAQVVIESQETS